MEGTTEADALTFADAIAKAEAGDPCPFGAWVKKDPTATGWHLQWTCKAAPTASKAFTNVDVRAIIDGKHFSCGNQVSTPDDLASVAAACASLKKL